MRKGIIDGSETWIKRVPDKYAIKHVEAYLSAIDKNKMILKFFYVKNCCRVLGSGFIEKCGIIKVPFNIGEYVDGIIICQNDVSECLSFYSKTENEIKYEGQVTKCEVFDLYYKPHNFSKTIYYSERDIERQKYDEHAPEWLKDFARRNGANVVYYEF